MTNLYNDYPVARERHPLYEVCILVIFVFIGLFVGYFIGVMVALAILGFDMATFQSLLTNPTANPASWNIIMLLQAVPALGAFIIAPLIFIQVFVNRPVQSLNSNKYVWLIPALLTVFLVISFMPFNALFIEWNNKMNLPGWLEGVEQWMQQKEIALKELTEYLTSFDTLPQLLIGFVVIALIPAIGEELLFRGLIQPRMYRLTGNIHAAIWITGFIFSAIHLQFYGLIPRMLLGVLFGYLYIWSGNLWYPIIGHFTNNGFTLLMIYLHNRKTIDLDIEATSSVPVGTAVLSGVVTLSILFALNRYYFRKDTSTAS
jgi:membrane protease YdiL (CAAX protease family)